MTPLPQARILALDLEGTLVSNVVSQIPRPGLRAFLEACRAIYPEIVIFSAANPSRVKETIGQLVQEGSAPEWFRDVPVYRSVGSLKNLRIIGDPQDILWVDDAADVPEGQEPRLYRIPAFESPYGDDDDDVLITISQQVSQ